MAYLALIGCTSDKTGARYEPGDVVQDGDFPKRVIKNWLKIDPPVLEEIAEADEEE